MGQSNIKIPRLCEFCGQPFEAKQIRSRFCSRLCAVKASQQKKKEEQSAERENLLQAAAGEIAAIQTRPYITVAEATKLFGISKDTIRRLIKQGKIPAVNLGERLTRISRVYLEAMFQEVPLPVEEQYDPQPIAEEFPYQLADCYTINEIAEKYAIAQPTASWIIRKSSVPRHKEGRFVYVPKVEAEKLMMNYKTHRQ